MLQVLLVEPNNLVRHCLILYLKKLGLDVRAVCSEDQAISCLRLQGISEQALLDACMQERRFTGLEKAVDSIGNVIQALDYRGGF